MLLQYNDFGSEVLVILLSPEPDSIDSLYIMSVKKIPKKRLPEFGFAIILEKVLDKHLYLPIRLYIATSLSFKYVI